MKTRLEQNELTSKYLGILGIGYQTGDFSPLFPHLSKRCIMESQWVLTPNMGYDAVTSYLTEKGKTLQKTKSFPSCSVQELVGNINMVNNAEVHVNGEEVKHASVGLLYEAGELCLIMEQNRKKKSVTVLVRIKIDEDDKISRIDLCMPEFFQYRDFISRVSFIPVRHETEVKTGMICINENYFQELYLFFDMAGVEFDEYGDLQIPMKAWNECVKQWEIFYKAESFDTALELLGGIDYSNFTVGNLNVVNALGRCGKTMWQNRKQNANIINDIIEWTNKYKDDCEFINTYGF